MNSSGPDCDEARLGGRGVGIDEALGQEDRLGGLAVLAAPRAAVHQPRPRAPVVAHRLAPLRPAAPVGGEPAPISERRPSAVNGRASSPGHRRCHRELTAHPLILPASETASGKAMAYFGVTASAAGLQAAAPGEDLEAGLRRRLRDGADGAPDRRAGPRLQVPSRRRPAPTRTARSSRSARPATAGGSAAGPRGSASATTRGESGPLHRLRLAGQRADAGEPRHHRAHRLRPGLRPRRRLRRAARRARGAAAAAGARAAGRPARPFPRRAGGARRAAASRRGAGAGDPARRRRVRRPRARLPRAPAARRGRRRSTTSPPAPTTSTTSPSRPSPRAAPGASGRSGSGSARRCPCWLDLQLDRAEVTAWINALGIPLTAASARLCHWGFYTRGGALAVYQAILRRRPGWDIASLRAAPCFAAQEPRWSRLLPRRPAPPRPPLGDRRRASPALDPAAAARHVARPEHLEWHVMTATDRALLLADAERLEDHHRAPRDGAALRPQPGEHRQGRAVQAPSS